MKSKYFHFHCERSAVEQSLSSFPIRRLKVKPYSPRFSALKSVTSSIGLRKEVEYEGVSFLLIYATVNC